MPTTLKVLVVDDEPQVVRLIRQHLGSLGCEMLDAFDGAEAWERALDWKPDVVLMDRKLPDVDGAEICHRIKSSPELPGTLVILTSGYMVDEDERASGFESGADAYLAKPFNGRELQALVTAMARIRNRERALEDSQRELKQARRAALSMMQDAERERTKAEEAWSRLQASTQSLRLLSRAIENSPAVVMITNADGQIEYVNPKFTELTGYSVEETAGKTPRILRSGMHPRAFFTELWTTIKAGSQWRGEICNRKKDGTLYWQSASIAPVTGDDGVTHFVAVTEDITERRRFIAELQEARRSAEEASKAKSSFLANMSHEIRTPMNAVLGFTDLLLRDSTLTGQQRERLGLVGRAGEHLLDLINDILEMSKIEAGRAVLNPANFDLFRTIEDLARLFELRAHKKGLAFDFVHLGELPRFVVGDEGKLRQVLINLLGNAVKFTDHGSVTLKLGLVDGPARLFAEVVDTGPGIPEEDHDKLFQSFGQTETGIRAGGGTGLGLAICRAYAGLMNGSVSFVSAPGEGSTFRFEFAVELGREEDARGRAPARVLRLEAGQAPCRVLIVDDLAENRLLLTDLLAQAGFETAEASGGLEALAAFDREPPSLVLMDQRMPDLDGKEATRRIKATARGRNTPVLVVSASALEENRREALEAGADGFIRKPFRPDDVFGEIARVCGVRYVTHEGGESGPSEAVGSPLLAAERVRSLPADSLAEMRSATTLGDKGRLLAIIDGLAPEHRSVGDGLKALAEEYQYEALLSLFGEG